MALIKQSAITSDIIGKVGGSVFQRTSSGLSLRAQPGGRKGIKSNATESMQGMQYVQWKWSDLAQGDKTAWDQYAIYNPRPTRKLATVFLKGHQVFLVDNHLRYMMRNYGSIFSTYLLSTPVFTPPPSPITLDSIERDGAALLLNTNETLVNTTDAVILYLSRILTAGQRSPNFKSKMIRFFTASGTEQNIGAYYTSVYGDLPVANDYIGYRMAKYDSTSKTTSSFIQGITQVV